MKSPTERKSLAARSRGIGRFLKRLFRRGDETPELREEPPREARTSTPSVSTPVQRRSDIPLEVFEHLYTPLATSSKASFRSNGADHARDQELAFGIADDRWNDEDRLTNKSGDPRIGTHNRTHAPADSRPDNR